MKKAFFALLLTLVAFSADAAKRSGTLKLATMAPSKTSFHVALQVMKEQWSKAPNGGVNLTIYADGTQGSEKQMVQRMRLGQIDAALLTVEGLSEIDRGVTALQFMPMMFRDLAEVEFVSSRMEPMLNRRLNDQGFVALCWADAGWVRFFSRRKAMTPGDLRSQKILAVAGSNRQIDLMKRLGYTPVPLEFSDALIALRTEMIDAVPTAPFHALAGQYYTVASNMIDVNWVPLVGALVIRKKTWDALPQDTRAALLRAAVEAGRTIQTRGRNESDLAVAAMQKRKLVVHTLTPEARREWERLAATSYPHIRGTLVPADVFDEVEKLLASYRRTHAAGRP